jgi:hypothetical protein
MFLTSVEKLERTLAYVRVAAGVAQAKPKPFRGLGADVVKAQLGALEALIDFVPTTLEMAKKAGLLEEWSFVSRWLVLRLLKQGRLYARMCLTKEGAATFQYEPFWYDSGMLKLPLPDQKKHSKAYTFQTKIWKKLRDVQIRGALLGLGYDELVMSAKSAYFPNPIKWKVTRSSGKSLTTFDPLDTRCVGLSGLF